MAGVIVAGSAAITNEREGVGCDTAIDPAPEMALQPKTTSSNGTNNQEKRLRYVILFSHQ
jgi:hypothetical protein